MKKPRSLIVLVLILLIGASACADGLKVSKANARRFGTLLGDLTAAYENPSARSPIEADLEAIRAVSDPDYDLARAIADHWRKVYLEDYPLLLHDGGERAAALEQTGLPDSGTHAFVVLGYQLKNGEMAEELVGRCDAAAAAARSFPNAVLVCSGGATGSHNPEKHTEAGLMKAYLADSCGIDASRIFIDEEATSTLENAVNTFEILRRQEIRTITIVTSSYHQRWGQAVYNAATALCLRDTGWQVDIVGNYSYAIEPSDQRTRQDDRVAVTQIASLLGLPKSAVSEMRKGF